MRYRVVFSKRTQSDGQASAIDPTAEVDVYLTDGVVAEKVFVERLESAAQHSQEVLDEDDSFLGSATPEAWEYEVVDEREEEFLDAMRKSQVVINYAVIDESETSQEDATAVALQEGGESADSETAAIGDGPAGMATIDRSAGGMPEGRAASSRDADAGGLDDLTIVDADDPSLGLTDAGERGADWAANTGPTREADRGAVTRDITDKSSTLRQPPSKAKPNRPAAKKKQLS